MKRRAVNRSTGKAFEMNEISYDQLEDELHFTLIPFVYDVMDRTTIESLNLSLRVLAQRLNIRDKPIIHPESGQFIWGFEPVRIDFTKRALHVEYKFRRDT
jgi:hypothetical protein